jgi:DNA-binding CsgD family transcriptional regulator
MGTEQVELGDVRAALASFQECLRYADRANNRMGIADGIERIASLSIGTPFAREGAQLAGAAQSLRDRSGAKGIPAILQFAAELHSRLIETLGDDAYRKAIAFGRELTPRQASSRARDLAEQLVVIPFPEQQAAAPATTLAVANPFRLTKREVEVLRLLSEGKTDREIAAALFISPRTAGSHVTNIFGKMEVDSRAAAVATAFRNNLI